MLLQEFKFPPSACGSLANALLKYFDDQPAGGAPLESRKRSRNDSQLNDLPPFVDESCDKERVLQFVATVSADTWIVYPEQPVLVIRKQEYPPIWAIVEEMLLAQKQKNHHLLVKGHAGIGKSCMLNYLLWRWTHSDELNAHVLVVALTESGLYVFAQKQRFWFRRSEVYEVAELILKFRNHQQQKVLVLHDLKTATLPFNADLYHQIARHWNVTCVLASSPNPSNFKTFMQLPATEMSQGNSSAKFGNHITWCLGPWSSREMSEYCKKLNPTLLAACSWDEALDLAGGVPRSWSM